MVTMITEFYCSTMIVMMVMRGLIEGFLAMMIMVKQIMGLVWCRLVMVRIWCLL